MIKTADYIIDLGPEGGEAGGQIVATGTPEQVAQVEASHTGRYLRATLAEGRSHAYASGPMNRGREGPFDSLRSLRGKQDGRDSLAVARREQRRSGGAEGPQRQVSKDDQRSSE